MTKASEASPKKHHHWKLISHLLLNHVSLTETEPLQEILGLYTYSTDASIYTQIRGIQKVESKPVWKRLGSIPGTGIVRGIQTNLTLDQAAFVGHSIFLFGSILDRFLAGYIGVNSFNYFVLKTSATSGDWHSWTPRAGNIPLV